MAVSIRQSVLIGGGAAAALTGIIAGAGFVEIAQLSRALDANTKSLQAVRRHVEGDMLHDGLRADVLAALSNPAETGLTIEQVQSDTSEHAAWFRRLVQENKEAGLDPEIVAALSAVEPLLDAYIGSALEIVSLAGTDRAAAAAKMPEFGTRFEELEVALEHA
jgi:methyl-accepting chemotaxis protein